MLLPRISLRKTLALMTGSALVFAIAGFALKGHAWAIGVTVAISSVLVALLAFSFVYLLSAAFSRLVGAEVVVAKTSRGAVVRDSGQDGGQGAGNRIGPTQEAP